MKNGGNDFAILTEHSVVRLRAMMIAVNTRRDVISVTSVTIAGYLPCTVAGAKGMGFVLSQCHSFCCCEVFMLYTCVRMIRLLPIFILDCFHVCFEHVCECV